ncbi:protein NETWORKED 4A-like [Melia azedarach]|nr:protein NETWORKED 4A-like [Melia azedarach]
MKRLESRKSHSWWWDSHISPKNSKWLAENLEEMDQRVKRMLKLIEEDADSFAKKAEMYYQKRPELISLVEEFYRMYRALAERYDNVTGELRKNIPSDLQSQGSGISDVSSELPSTCPSPDQKPSRRKSGPRAAGFDVFLGSGGSNTDLNQKDADESSSSTDSDSESDSSSVNNYSGFIGNGGVQGMQRKIIELEMELCEAKEKLSLQGERNAGESIKDVKNKNSEDLLARIAAYEQQLRLANENLQQSNEEITRLKIELQKYKLSELPINMQEGELESEISGALKLQEGITGSEVQTLDMDSKIQALMEELRITKEKLQFSEEEISSLKNQLEINRSEKIQILEDQLQLAQKDIATWKSKLNSERKTVSKLQERITRLKTSLADRDHEVRNLKMAVSDAEEKIFPEKAQIKAEISGLLEEKTCLEEHLRDWESRGRSLEEEIRKIKAEKTELEQRLYAELEQLKADIAERDDHIEDLNGSLNTLRCEREGLHVEVRALKEDVIYRDNQINKMKMHLEQLHMEHVKLIASTEEAGKLVSELRSRAKELEEEIEKQRVMILEGAEEKREAIRQLCFSLEHYRNSYINLRKAFIGHKGVAVLAS